MKLIEPNRPPHSEIASRLLRWLAKVVVSSQVGTKLPEIASRLLRWLAKEFPGVPEFDLVESMRLAANELEAVVYDEAEPLDGVTF